MHNIAGSSNGRTGVFGTPYLGSNPSPAARVSAVFRTKNYSGIKGTFLLALFYGISCGIKYISFVV